MDGASEVILLWLKKVDWSLGARPITLGRVTRTLVFNGHSLGMSETLIGIVVAITSADNLLFTRTSHQGRIKALTFCTIRPTRADLENAIHCLSTNLLPTVWTATPEWATVATSAPGQHGDQESHA